MEHIQLRYNYDNSCYYDEENKIRFLPLVYEQRYLVVQGLLELDIWKSSFKKIIEFGCAELKYFTFLKTLPDLEQAVMVDIDEELLNRCYRRVDPSLVDFIDGREKKLNVEVWRGSISVAHECLLGADVVIGIEIIEHLHADVLEGVPENVFGYIKPKVAMFSTPNSEYNIYFDGLLENGFRHDDHKFEWTRAEFAEWGEDILRRYPDYVVKYFGIGPPPQGATKDVGYVSQLAVFVRKDFLSEVVAANAAAQENAPAEDVRRSYPYELEAPANPNLRLDEESGEIVLDVDEDEAERLAAQLPPSPMNEDEDVEEVIDRSDDDQDDGPELVGYYIPPERHRNDSGNFEDEPLDPNSGEYKLLYSLDYPIKKPDTRPRPEKLLTLAECRIRQLKFYEDLYYSYEHNQFRIPLRVLVEAMDTIPTTVEEMTSVLTEASYQITDGGEIIVPFDEGTYASDDDFEYDVDQLADEAEEKACLEEEGDKSLNQNDESWD